jgi:hypothetical protein
MTAMSVRIKVRMVRGATAVGSGIKAISQDQQSVGHYTTDHGSSAIEASSLGQQYATLLLQA